MRSHAKASTAGSARRQAKGLGAILCGAAAPRGTSIDVDGSGAPAVERLVLSICALAGMLAVLVFAAAPASAAVPAIASTWSEDVVFTEATLKAEINPEGLATTYHFEYGPTEAYGSETAEITAGEDSSIHKVSRFLTGLSPDTTYHYRVVATNGDGPAQSPDRTFTTYEPFSPDTNCANQAFRIGASANLPDCRAYEMVSPVEKNGAGILTTAEGEARAAFDQASLDGDKLTYSSSVAFGDATSGRYSNQYLSSRGPNGWTTHGISASLGEVVYKTPLNLHWDFDTMFQDFSDDLSTAWLKDQNAVPLTEDAVEGFGNIYRQDIATGTYHEPLLTEEPILRNEGGEYPELLQSTSEDDYMAYRGRSQDGSRTFFEVSAQLTPDAAPTVERQIYELSEGELKLVSVLPDGTANPDFSTIGFNATSVEAWAYKGRAAFADAAISQDGSRVFWTASPGGGNDILGDLYVRVDGELSVPISQTVTSKPARFWTASADGSKALFSFAEGETTAGESLYEFDVDTETPTLIAKEVPYRTTIAGAADDLSRFYFVSREALDAGAAAGNNNFYEYHKDTAHFIGALSSKEVQQKEHPHPVHVKPYMHTTRITADGRHLLFTTEMPLTGYDNTDRVTGRRDLEVYLYDADVQELTCVSCNPSGARPVGRVPDLTYTKPGAGGDLPAAESQIQAAAWIRTWEHESHASRFLSGDGNRVFFHSFDVLVPQDTNGVQDVYQWEAAGAGKCQLDSPAYSALNKGCVSLISTGKSLDYSEFVDASPDGNDVFIRTLSSLDPRDPGLFDIYDARVGGGFPPPPPPPPACVGDACQVVPAPPSDPTPASAAFRGAGDPKPRKPQKRCRVRKRSSKAKAQAKRKAARPCRRAGRRAGR